MKHASENLQFFLDLAKTQTILTRRFDAGLGGLSLNEFVILLHLSKVKEGSMRRTDLAEKTGLTASGVTRLLAPMEKIGLIKRMESLDDARVSSVAIASGGKKKLEHALENAEMLIEDLLPEIDATELARLALLLQQIR